MRGSVPPVVVKCILNDNIIMTDKVSVYKRIYAVVGQIPWGKVATYGQVASLVDKCNARMVGYAMSNLPCDTDVPWHRVVNRRGEISIRADGSPSGEQRCLLEEERICFDEKGCVDLRKVRWKCEVLSDVSFCI